jgi:hypothetical protein
MFRYFVLVLLVLGFVSGLDVELDCPRSVFVGENFSCVVEVDDSDAEYDLKVEIDSARVSVLEVLDSGEWKSSYYYLDEFVEDEAEVVLRFSEAGEFDFVVKLRDGSKRVEFDCGSIRVLDNGIKKEEATSFTDDLGGDGVISLNVVEAEVLDEEVVFVSREGRVVDLLPYLFCGFLVLLVGVLVWERV